MKTLSIIIPVYNGELYIRRCLESVESQKGISHSSLEVILINDGSKDSSALILEEYSVRNPQLFRVINQSNQGAAFTRNKGISLAKGEFVTLIDQDDWIDENYCKTLLDEMLRTHAEVIQSGFRLVDKDGKVIRQALPVATEFGRLLAIPAWAKIYRTSFLRDNKVRFFENNIGEDNVFTLKIYLLVQKYISIDYVGYNNSFDNAQNVTNTLHKGLSPNTNFIPLLEEMKRVDATNDKLKLLDYNLVRTSIYYLLSYGKYASSKRFVEVNDQLFAWMRANIENFEFNKYIWKRPPGEFLSASVGIKLVVILNSLHMINIFARLYCSKHSPKKNI